MSIKSRISIVISVFLISAFAFMGMIHHRTLKQAMLKEVDETLALRASSIINEIDRISKNSHDIANIRKLNLNLTSPENLPYSEIYVQVTDPDGKLLLLTNNLGGTKLPVSLSDDDTHFETIEWGRGLNLRVMTVKIKNGNKQIAVLLLAESMFMLSESLKQSLQGLIIGGVITLLAILFFTYIILTWALDPLKKTINTARSIITTGDFSRRVLLSERLDEIGETASVFNELINRVEQLLESQRQLLACTSHELRNPLTVIRADLDMLRRSKDSVSIEEIIVEAEKETERMSRLIDDLLMLSSIDDASLLQFEAVMIAPLAKEVVSLIKPMAGNRNIDLMIESQPAINGNRDRIRQIISNLMENAIRYTGNDGEIKVTIGEKGEQAFISFEDNGLGIPEEHLPHIFKRFYRVDKARSRRSGGTGLGLTIAKTFVEFHNGYIDVKSTVGRGSIFTVYFPAIP